MFDRSKKFRREAPPTAAENGGVATQQREPTYANGAAAPDAGTAPPPPAAAAPAAPVPADQTGRLNGDHVDQRTSTLEPAPAGERTATLDEGRAPVRGRARAAGDAVVLDREARLRQRDEFGGINWGASFFGWVVAIGIGVLLTAIASAAGAAIGLTDSKTAQSNAGTIGIVGGAVLILIAVIAYYAGGYVAGRMSRFDGARQGFGVWAFGLIVTLLVAAAGAILGDQYNVFEQLNLPRIPVSTSDLTTGGAIALAAILVGSLLAAVIGGKVGQRYHRRVDRAAIVD